MKKQNTLKKQDRLVKLAQLSLSVLPINTDAVLREISELVLEIHDPYKNRTDWTKMHVVGWENAKKLSEALVLAERMVRNRDTLNTVYFTSGSYASDSNQLAELVIELSGKKNSEFKESDIVPSREVWHLKMVKKGQGTKASTIVRFSWDSLNGGFQTDSDGTGTRRYHISSQVSGTSEFNGFVRWVMSCVSTLLEAGYIFGY